MQGFNFSLFSFMVLFQRFSNKRTYSFFFLILSSTVHVVSIPSFLRKTFSLRCELEIQLSHLPPDGSAFVPYTFC